MVFGFLRLFIYTNIYIHKIGISLSVGLSPNSSIVWGFLAASKMYYSVMELLTSDF